jgi:hypothetical protein
MNIITHVARSFSMHSYKSTLEEEDDDIDVIVVSPCIRNKKEKKDYINGVVVFFFCCAQHFKEKRRGQELTFSSCVAPLAFLLSSFCDGDGGPRIVTNDGKNLSG